MSRQVVLSDVDARQLLIIFLDLSQLLQFLFCNYILYANAINFKQFYSHSLNYYIRW